MQQFSSDPDAGRLPLLSAEARRSIAARAASLDELTARLAARTPLAAGDGEQRNGDMSALAAWLQACAPGDPDAFTQRLAWDGLDLLTAAWLLTDEAALELADDSPPWLTWLDRILEQAEAAAIDVVSGAAVEADGFTAEGLPYAEALVPMTRAAEAALAARLGAAWDAHVSPAARDAWTRQLARELSGLVQMALHQRFEALRAAAAPGAGEGGGEEGADPYYDFVVSLLHGGWPDLFVAYPVLARHAAVIIERHVANVTCLVRRFAADRDALAQAFGRGQPPGPIVDVRPALSDPHDGRQRVAVLTCAGGQRLVYKPRDVRMELAFSRVLEAMAASGCEAVPRGLDVVAGDGYGWEGFVESEPLTSIDEVRTWFRRAGGLLCVTWLLGGRDLHMENVVATRQGPVLVDLEALCAPGEAGPEADAPGGADTGVGQPATPASSCLQTGLLTYVAGGPDTPLREVGGLRGRAAGTSTLARRVWTGLRTAAIGFVEDTTIAGSEHNAVVLDGRRCQPEAFAGELASGFAEAYRHLRDRREAALAPGGLLDGFAGLRTRVFTRDTNQYGMLLHVLSGPKYQVSGIRRSAAGDVLVRGLASQASRPAEWEVVRAERAALDALDVPRFTQPVDATGVFAGTRLLLARPWQQPGLPLAAERWRAMSEADLAVQHAAILRVLGELARPRFTAPWPAREDDRPNPDSPEAWRACAVWIGREVIARGRRDAEGLGWHGQTPLPALRACALHDGALGPALLLSALAWAKAGPEFPAAAREALSPVTARWAAAGDDGSLPIGATTGLAGIAYGLGLAATLLEDAPLFETALAVARAVTPARIAADPHLDLVAGAAGATLALLALFHARPEPWLAAAAIRCGDHLLAAEDIAAPGTWRAPAGYAYSGFAHGIAGIAAALARLAGVTGLDRFHDAAARAFARLAATRAGATAWPLAFRPERPGAGRELPSMTAWCHGAPGITLALLAAPDPVRDAAWRAELEAAVTASASVAAHKTEHVCCGNLSRAEALFMASRRLGLAPAAEAAGRLASGVVRRAATLGHVRLSAVPYDYRVFDAAFFQGTSGAGYQLLRMGGGGRLPSVLAVEGRAAPAPEEPTHR